MDGVGFWALALVASVCVGLNKGGVPIIAMLAVPLLSLVASPVAAAGLLLPVYIVSDMFGLWAYRRDYNRDVLKIAFVGLAVGILLGWATAQWVPERLVRLIIGVIGVTFALNYLFREAEAGPARPVRKAPGLFWTGVAGFTSFVSHSGGPPWQVWVLPLRLSKLTFAGTTTIAFAYTNALKLIPYVALGQLGVAQLRTALILMIPAALSVLVGVRIVRVLPERLFFRIVTLALLAVSAKLIWDAIVG